MTTEAKDLAAREVIAAFENQSGLRGVSCEMRERSDGKYLLIHVGNATERLFGSLNRALDTLPDENEYKERTTLKRKARTPWLSSPEAQLLHRTLTESLTVDRYTFGDEFFSRYIPSVFGGESQISAAGNHIVFGRRGSGKSSLLLYALRCRDRDGLPCVWIDMQTYGERDDLAVIVEVFREILEQVDQAGPPAIRSLITETNELLEDPKAVSRENIRHLIPSFRRALGAIAGADGSLAIFLDDIHLVGAELQPELLASIYAACRGNRTHLSASGIEGFTRPWDPTRRRGLELPHDAQAIRLDYNLTMPGKSREHIGKILDSHAKYCGLPSVNVLCNQHTLNRLVWVAAGVPRDAINIFAQAMVLATTRDQKSITATSINSAASAASGDKLRSMQMDAAEEQKDLLAILEKVKEFCIKKEKKNAFLVEVKNDEPNYENIRKLIELRFIHILHDGLTPDRAGEKYVALMLDYGFYTGMRAAKTVDLFQKEPQTPTAKELRGLPRFRIEVDD